MISFYNQNQGIQNELFDPLPDTEPILFGQSATADVPSDVKAVKILEQRCTGSVGGGGVLKAINYTKK